MTDAEAPFDGRDEIRRLTKRLELIEVRLNNVNQEDDEDPARKGTFAVANPSPLGLISFGVVSWLSGVSKIASIPLTSPSGKLDNTLAFTGIVVGGVGQIIAGLIHYAKNNAHSATTFAFFGLHWIIQGLLLYGRGAGTLSHEGQEGITATYFALLALVTLLLWVPSVKMNRVLCTTLLIVFGVFLLDAIAAYGVRGAEVAAGVLSCIAGFGAFYMCAADLVNEVWRRMVIPVFPHEDHKDDYERVSSYIPRLHFHKSVTSSAHH